MTVVKYERNDDQFILTVNGHAGYAESGKDIVCASVSTLIYTLANALDNMGAIDELKLKDGDVRIVASPKNNSNAGQLEIVFDVIMGGFMMLTQKYNENVRVF